VQKRGSKVVISFGERRLERRRETLLHSYYLRTICMLDMSSSLNVKSGLCFVVFFHIFGGVGRASNLCHGPNSEGSGL
jgi:hypothetical protein